MNTRFVQLFSGETVQTVFKLAYLWLVLLSFNSLSADTAVLSCGSYALALFGAPVVLARIVDFKAYRDMPLIVLMCLFLVSFLFSAANTVEFGVTQNVQGFAWMAFEFLILFAHSAREDARHTYKEFASIASTVFWYTLACSSVGLLMAVVGFQHSYSPCSGTTNYFGIYVGRLWGVYSDPNIGATLCVISSLLTLWLRSIGRVSLPAAVLNLVVQSGYIALSGSRGALVCVIVSSLVLTGLFSFAMLSKGKLMKLFAAGGCALCGCALSLACIFGSGYFVSVCADVVQGAPSFVQSDESAQSELAEEPSESNDVGEPSGDYEDDEAAAGVAHSYTEEDASDALLVISEDKSIGIGTRDDMEWERSDYTTGRASIWLSAIEVFETSPIVGVSHRNILEYASATLPDTYIAKSGYTTMHNIIVDVLVSQGVVGVALFLAMAALSAVRLRKYFRLARDIRIEAPVMTSVLAAIVVGAMFYTEILYINSPASILFWITLGFICQISRQESVASESLG